MFGFFKRKKEMNKLKEDLQESFSSVKGDFKKVGQWIEHLDGKHLNHDNEISNIKSTLSELQNEFEEIKNIISLFEPGLSKHLSKQPQTVFNKQTAVQAVQTPVQTAVQTAIFSNLTLMERAIVWALINSDMNLSYEDISALLGKDKSTIRGQINAIKQKSEGLIEESREKNGKKRLYIPDEMKSLVLKSVKVRVKKEKILKKQEKE